jgi:hypothetical protein
MAPRLNIVLKAVLVALIATALVFGEAERFSDKAMGARAIAYPLLCAVPAAIWWIARRRRPDLPYPHAADALVTAAFIVDLGGNALDLFDRLTWYDDAAHFTNWLLLGLALGVTIRGRRPGWEVVWMVTGAGAVAAILWELAEYQSFVQKVEQLGIYRDTVGDLCLGTSGALVAGLIVVALPRPTPNFVAPNRLSVFVATKFGSGAVGAEADG